MPNWDVIFKSGKLEKLGKDCTTTRQLSTALANDINEDITVDSLFNAHKRRKDKLGLKTYLSEYTADVGDNDSKKKDKPSVVRPEDIKFELSDKKRKELNSANRIVITSALNNVDLHPGAWGALKTYVKEKKACLLVIPSRYRNPTSKAESDKTYRDAWWPHEVMPHMTDELIELNDLLWVMGHVRIQATAINPLSGLESLSKGSSAVFGHAQLAMKTVPTPQHQYSKIMYTTGSVSEPVYSDTKAGILGDFHHTLGALVVERDGSFVYPPRNVMVDDDGGFYDLDEYFSSDGVKKSTYVLGLLPGDEHAEFSDPKCKEATFTGNDSIVNVLKPLKIVRQDVLDFYRGSHHNRNNPVVQYGKHKYGYNRVEDEFEGTRRYIDETTPSWAENVIIPSNHHDHVLRWLKEVNVPRDEPWNLDLYLELWTEITKSLEFRNHGVEHVDPFVAWMREHLESKATFLPRDSDYTIGGILVGLHGDQGPNGSRGSVTQFARLGAKTVTGHVHAPAIKQGSFVVGTSSRLKMEYTQGPSSWEHCHCVIYPNGKRALLFVRDGKWRLNDKAKTKTRKRKK